jgi:hypothetical protein
MPTLKLVYTIEVVVVLCDDDDDDNNNSIENRQNFGKFSS